MGSNRHTTGLHVIHTCNPGPLGPLCTVHCAHPRDMRPGIVESQPMALPRKREGPDVLLWSPWRPANEASSEGRGLRALVFARLLIECTHFKQICQARERPRCPSQLQGPSQPAHPAHRQPHGCLNSSERRRCSFGFCSACCLSRRCQREGPVALSWVRERVMTSMWLEHETKPSKQEQKMTQRLRGYLFVQAANPRPS